MFWILYILPLFLGRDRIFMQKKRFIAGAKCPKCNAFDSVFTYFEHGKQYIRCTECDFEQEENQVPEKQSELVIQKIKPQ